MSGQSGGEVAGGSRPRGLGRVEQSDLGSVRPHWALPKAVRTIWVAMALLLVSPRAQATIPIYEGDEVTFDLSGYLRSLSGIQHFTYDTGGLFPDVIGLSAAITRFEWGLNLGENVTVEIHDRFFWQVTSADMTAAGSRLGLGVSTPPGRHLDLRSVIVDPDHDGFLLEHDVDRLALRLYFESADLAVGRQAISWGRANLFPSIDLWTQFSPFDLDTSQKRGTDALRLFATVSERADLEVIVADRGERDDDAPNDFANFFLDFAAGTHLFLERSDLFVGAGKLFDSLMLLGSLTADLEKVTVRLDAALPYDMSDDEVALPRATAGLDYIHEDLYLTVEYHFNGAGVANTEDYLEHGFSDTIQRGETYLLGRHYAGTVISYVPVELVTANLAVIANLQDPSVILTPTLDYEVSSDVNLSLGSYIGVGESPELERIPPLVNSEFGSSGNLYYVQAAAFW